jgi:maltose O-acetyltransferase
MGNLAKKLHLYGLKRRWVFFVINKFYSKTNKFFKRKRNLLRSLGFEIGEGTKIVGPIYCTGTLTIGKNCWIGKNLRINGNGTVCIGDNCDLGPEITFQTGGHEIGPPERRAGKGLTFHQTVGNGTWIGGRSTILNNTHIGNGCSIAGCACVTKDVPDNTLVGGVPARIIKKLDNENTELPQE